MPLAISSFCPRLSSRQALAIASMAASLVLSGCMGPPLSGDGSTAIRVRLVQFETVGAELLGTARVEITDFVDSCPGLVGPPMYRLENATDSLEVGDAPSVYPVKPGHIIRLSLRHQSRKHRGGATCKSEIWLEPKSGTTYDFEMYSNLESCRVTELDGAALSASMHSSCKDLEAAMTREAGETSSEQAP